MSKRSKITYIRTDNNSNKTNSRIINIKLIYNQNNKNLRKELNKYSNKYSNKSSSKPISKILRITLYNLNKFCGHYNNKNTLSI